MLLQSNIQNDAQEALRSGDKARRQALSYIVSEIKSVMVNKRLESLANSEVNSVLQKQLKQRQETLKAAQNGNRAEMVEQNEYEIKLIQSYLPQALSEKETNNLAAQVVRDMNATTIRDMGKVIAEASQREPGVDKSMLSKIVKGLLS